MDNDFEHYTTYLKQVLEKKQLKLVIIGIDRYEKNYKSYIPFCKEEWDQQLNNNSSGSKIVRALMPENANIETYLGDLRRSYKKPKDYFMYLLETHGIAFLNISYAYYTGEISKSKFDCLKTFWEDYNQGTISNTAKVIMCGRTVQSYLMHKLGSQINLPTFQFAYHPAARAGHQKNTQFYTPIWGDSALSCYLTKQ